MRQHGVVEIDKAFVGLQEDFLNAIAVIEEIGGGTVGGDDGSPMTDVPGLLIADAYLLGAGVVALGADDRHAEHLQAVACGYDCPVAMGLLGKCLLCLNGDAFVLRQAGHVVDRGEVGSGKEGCHGRAICQC